MDMSSADCQEAGEVNQSVDTELYMRSLPGVRVDRYADRDEIVAQICERLAKGEALIRICESKHLPSRWTVVDWMRTDEEVALQISRARELGEDYIANDALRIADGELPLLNTPNDPQRDKLRIETRLKLLAKFNPKRWGDSTQLRHADADGQKLDTAPLVSELLALLPGAQGSAPVAKRDAVSARLVSEAPAELERQAPAARPAYRPRPARSDVDDLV